MICRKCKKEIPDDAVYCCYCRTKQKREPLKTKRRANGMGCVKRLAGRRRKPWAVLITKNKKQMYMGFYTKQTEAEEALAKITPDAISERYNYTLEKVYEDWKSVHFRGLTDWGEQGYKSAWTHFQEIKNMKMREIKTDTLQKRIDTATSAGLSRSVCEKMKQLASQLCKYAMQQDIINKNYAQFIALPKGKPKAKEIFTDKEIDVLFAHDNDERVRIILAMIYTGFRVDELLSLLTEDTHIDDGYVVGGEKTEAGKNRIVPINDLILPYFKSWYEKASASGTDFLIANNSGNKKDVKNFRSREFYPVLQELGILPAGKIDKGHPPRLTPHSTRHTFASLAASAGVPPETLRKLIGHADYSTTANIYIHENLDQLKAGIGKIKRKKKQNRTRSKAVSDA